MPFIQVDFFYGCQPENTQAANEKHRINGEVQDFSKIFIFNAVLFADSCDVCLTRPHPAVAE